MNALRRILALAIALLAWYGGHAQVQDSSSSWSMPGLTVPSNIQTVVTYDPLTGLYMEQKYIGSVPFGLPIYYTPAEYRQHVFSNQEAQN